MGTIVKTNAGTIRKSLAEQLAELNGAIVRNAKDDALPREAKIGRRVGALTVMTDTIAEADAAFREWLTTEREAAETTLKQRPIGSAAEESRRVADELRLNRMIDSARRSGTPQIATRDLAGQASAAFLDARDESGYREAALLARAAIEVGGNVTPSAARSVLDAAEKQLETREQQEARKTLAAIEAETLAYQRDRAALMASTLTTSAEAADAVGDKTAADLRKHAARQSATAKMMEFSLAQAAGRDYAEPMGTLSGVPTSTKPGTGPTIEYGRSGDGRLAVAD